MYACVYANIICLRKERYMKLYTCICSYSKIYTHIYIYIYIYIYIHIYIYIYMYIYIHALYANYYLFAVFPID